MYDLAECEIDEPLFWNEFRSVVESPSIEFVCKSLYQRVDIHEDGSCSGCCDAWLKKKLCNVMSDDGDEVYNSIWAKIMKLSCLLHTYNFCDWDNCPYLRKYKNLRPIEDMEIDYGGNPNFITYDSLTDAPKAVPQMATSSPSAWATYKDISDNYKQQYAVAEFLMLKLGIKS